jgi:hypothetical protein
MALLALPASAKSKGPPDLGPFDRLWAGCQGNITNGDVGDWVGWHRDLGGGYADNFEFYDGYEDVRQSTLKVSVYIDGIAAEDTTWCYRDDGVLAMIAITMRSPDMVAGGGMGPLIAREGRLYFDEKGYRIAVRGWLADAQGNKVGTIDSVEHQLARGCSPVDLRLNAGDARAAYVAELGDIEGNRPVYAANELGWCAEAEEGP